MTAYWEPGVQYDYGTVVEYEGVQYRIIQPHRSQGDWTPPVTPALWGRIPGGGCRDRTQYDCGEERKSYSPGYTTEPCQPPTQQHHDDDKRPYELPLAVQPEKEKHWYDGKEEQLKIGGGILAGAAAIGAGIWAMDKHKEHKEERAAQKWSRDMWVADAHNRLDLVRRGQCTQPVMWVWNTGKEIPRNAIRGGEEKGEVLYICRAYHEGGLMIGKACCVFKKGAVIGYRSEEIHLDEYEILVGDARAVTWVNVHGKLEPDEYKLVEGGREPSGAPQYIAQAPYHGAVHPGKACEDFGAGGCYIPYGGQEKQVKEYAVLCYA